MVPPLPSSRLTKTTTKPFEMIFAVSQMYLNQNLRSFWDLPENAIFHHLNDDNIAGTIDADLDAPEVELVVTGSGVGGVYFYMKFKTGTMTLNGIHKP